MSTKAQRQLAAQRQREWRARNPEKVQREIDEQRRNREVINALKDSPCIDCQNRFPVYVMDWDHVRGTKLANVSDMRKRNTAMAKILAEIAKCDLVCSNCHRIRTYVRSMSKSMT